MLDDLLRARAISSGSRGGAWGSIRRKEEERAGGLGGKKWLRSDLLRSTGEDASGKEGNLSESRPSASRLAVHTVLESTLERKAFQCSAFALFMALK